jgi:hypothetical protein
MKLGYVNFNSLKMMVRKEMLKGQPSIIHPNQLCEGCLVGKQFCSIFLKESKSRANQLLQEIHADIFGPIKPCSFDKNANQEFFEGVYFLLIIIVERFRYTS